jgi:hypothetical protein
LTPVKSDKKNGDRCRPNALTSIILAFSGQTPMSQAPKRHSKSAGTWVLKWQLCLQERSGH